MKTNPPPAPVNSAAFKVVQDLATELSTGTVDLPGFPRIFTQVCRALDDPKSTNERTSKIVSAEPALAARLLTMANSAAFTQTGKPIADLRSAITRLGSNSIRAAASAFAVSQLKRQSSLASIADRLETLWTRSTYIAAMCHVIARNCKVNSDQALLTGLLHAMGTLYLLVRTSAHPELLSSEDVFADLAAEWNAPITKSILENWSFPEDIVQASGDQEDFERKHAGGPDLADVLICAKALFACDNDRVCIQAKFGQVPALAKVGLSIDQYLSVIQHAHLQIAAMQDAFRV
jgi:HD-like signal output (HDOD) protein